MIMYVSVQNLMSSRLVSRNGKSKIYISIIVVIYECETRSLALRKEHRALQN
jgi:hypothetical protein